MEDSSVKWSELSNIMTERDLGIMVSEELSWEVQIDSIVKKANRILGMLKRTFYSFTCKATSRARCSSLESIP